MKLKFVMLVVAASLICGCTDETPRKNKDIILEKGMQVFDTPATKTYLIPTTLEDGTRCVIVSGYYGKGITCEWKK